VRAALDVTAIHNSMPGDEPRLFFMHVWANDDTQKVRGRQPSERLRRAAPWSRTAHGRSTKRASIRRSG
jgi:hypothetical protein